MPITIRAHTEGKKRNKFFSKVLQIFPEQDVSRLTARGIYLKMEKG